MLPRMVYDATIDRKNLDIKNLDWNDLN